MKNIVGLKEFRNNVDVWIKHVKHGNSVVVMKRSEPIFRVSPVEEEIWEEITDPKLFVATAAQKKALIKAEQNLEHGKSLSYHDTIRKLGLKN
ncbi:MAG: hypothetical protein A3B10_00150 [Candidatus Doudnabacteria bacterium RIFCSPLOWO2_01_FULL_44_21]|uniref:Antitoxin n=1 Tax=Candidatus Doudnabacteria bacterium RIFCSPLOWO2_01_FULL_44_21 TaxID=1817841 RepID=A0A1F5PXB9_9BACT|nr:MAG: hypothetical protein A3B95_03605 [Candidatus Doudnabacteria bacterium RIFCSPHIGHO2_02_FULL_43_13b]OGE94559.1 MAG: hypothetical protein A3B10_00150 [Candidatus Doudnabacteria bacterium RIFCSPLOWO2_01_FULL_44_21]